MAVVVTPVGLLVAMLASAAATGAGFPAVTLVASAAAAPDSVLTH